MDSIAEVWFSLSVGEWCADNLRGVLHALESNFQVPPTDEDKVMLEVVGFPYEDFDSDNAVPEDDPVHVSSRPGL